MNKDNELYFLISQNAICYALVFRKIRLRLLKINKRMNLFTLLTKRKEATEGSRG